MSTLWTPSGEYTPRPEPEPRPAAADARQVSDAAPPADDELAAQAGAVREQLLAAPAVDVIANSALGLFEIAALYLGAGPSRRSDAQLAIDAFATFVENFGSRLGRHERMLRDALAQLQLAFVESP